MADDESHPPTTPTPTLTPAPTPSDYYQKGVEFATSRVSSAPQDDYDDDYDETTPPPQPSLESGYCSQSTSSSLELSQPDQPVTTITPPVIKQESTTQPPTDTSTPMDTTPAEDTSNTDDSAIPEDMSIEELHAKVMKMFPGFKPHGILRFSSLLGAGKKSSLPQVWKGAQKPKRRSVQKGELRLDIDWVPPPEMIRESDEVGGVGVWSVEWVEWVCVQCGVWSGCTSLLMYLLFVRCGIFS